jgi:hypothetical protein
VIVTEHDPRVPNPLEFETDTPEADPLPSLEFKFATLRGTAPPEDPCNVAEPPITDPRRNAEQVPARLLARSKVAAVPMPDIPGPEEE